MGIDPILHQLNEHLFIPIHIKAKGADENKVFHAYCCKCLLEKKKKICNHSMKNLKWTDVYNLQELAYAICSLKYTFFCIDEVNINKFDFLEIICSLYFDFQLFFRRNGSLLTLQFLGIKGFKCL